MAVFLSYLKGIGAYCVNARIFSDIGAFFREPFWTYVIPLTVRFRIACAPLMFR